MAWPTDITAMDKGRVLEVAFDDGHVIRLTAERLRVESPSAEVQGHSPSQKKIVTGKDCPGEMMVEVVKPVMPKGGSAVTEVKWKEAFPVLVTLTVCEVVVPSACGGNVTVFGVIAAAAVVITPVPVKVTIEGVLIPAIMMEICPL